VQIVQALKLYDMPCCFVFAKDILSNVKSDENYVQRWIFNIEAMFYVSRRVNHRNYKIQGSKNPHAFQETKRDSAKVNAWCPCHALGMVHKLKFFEFLQY
jgi:hypothetical protein